ncbi:MAG: pirin family protein [Alphaproteobacteria bacterium]|nr:pirin family protein [Alphaproteobacteria bacterium]
MIDTLISRRARDLGGFVVGRVLPFAGGRMVGPFVFFDHMGPARFEPGLPASADVRPHPHIGLSTVTYLFDGEIMHRDSVGSQQPIRAEEVNWMIAGRGITHSERFEKGRATGDTLHGIQAWVALPVEHEETDPGFAHHGRADLPLFEDGGARVRLIAGEAYGARSPVQVHSPLFYAHATLQAGARLPAPEGHAQRAVYVVTGALEIDGVRVDSGQMAILGPGAATLVALEPTIAMALGGADIGPRHIEWNFVSSSKERIEQAKADWRAGRMKLPDLDHDEFIPLPG